MNLYEQQSSNRRKTWLIMLVFVALLTVLGLGFDAFFVGVAGGNVPVGTLAALGLGSVSALASYYGGDRAVLAATGAQPVEELAAAATDDVDKLKLSQLANVVDEMAIAAGLPRPRVYVVPDQDPNAFATGRGPDRSSIAVTRGLLDALDRDELQGVVAHEMSHIKNLDVRVMTIVAALVGAVALLSDWAQRGMWWGGGPSRRDGGRDDGRDDRGNALTGVLLFVLWLGAITLAPLLAQALAMMVSRRREYLADASGAELTRNPLGLARALE
jgi:heat shock protein HtpX